MKICSIDGCGGKHVAKGFCSTHYQRLRFNGGPLVLKKTANGEARAFVAGLLFAETDECINWPFALDRSKADARPCFGLNGETTLVYRYLCEKTHGPAPSTKHHAAHGCNNGLCVNRRHICWKTPQENYQDQVLAGTYAHGERHGHAKLTEEQVLYIRSSDVASTIIASRFGVANATVRDVMKKKTWRHLL